MPTATKFWLIFPAIVLLALSVVLFVRWPFRIDRRDRVDELPSSDFEKRR